MLVSTQFFQDQRSEIIIFFDSQFLFDVFSGNAYQDLLDSGIEKIVTCNTIPHPSNAIDLSDILAKEVKKLMQHI